MTETAMPGAVPALRGWRLDARILGVLVFNFLCYLTVGLPLAVLPGVVHEGLGYDTVVAGAAVSVQYLATVFSRPQAGRMSDAVGAKHTVLLGLAACGAGGVLLAAAARLTAAPGASLALIVVSRLAIGFGESWVGTGALMWGMGRVGMGNSSRVISVSGICTYSALAVGAPLGVALMALGGMGAVGLAMAAAGFGGWAAARRIAGVPLVAGRRMGFAAVLARVTPLGSVLMLGVFGFATISTFVALFFSARHWSHAAFALTAFGLCFVAGRLVFSRAVTRHGGYRVALVSLAVEGLGLLVLGLAGAAWTAIAAAGLAGLGFALVFPALGAEAVRIVPASSRGAAMAAFTAFGDVALGLAGPLAGLVAAHWGFRWIYVGAALLCGLACAASVWLSRRPVTPAD